jgi:uncharacterized protein YdhG (YjbR/CyaY superfamily)
MAGTQEGPAFSAEEKAAMKARAVEARTAKKGKDVDQTPDVLAKIAGMRDGDRQMAERVHAIVTAAVPELRPRLYYGMPAYALNGTMLCFFKDSGKFKERFSTLGFSDKARLDEGTFWPKEYAVVEITPEVEARITELVRRAAGA